MTRCILIAALICGVILMGLTATSARAFEVVTKEDLITKVVTKKALIKTADNAIILFDSSDSMSKPFLDTNMSRYEVARNVLKERNEYIPDLGYNVGLYLYTPWTPLYPVQPYDREKFAQALEQLPDKPRGATYLQLALGKLEDVLKGLDGRTVVFVLTDGTFSQIPGRAPRVIAEKLAKKYNVCFYVITTADDEASREVVNRLAAANFCSRVIPFEAFINRPEYNSGALYVVGAKFDIQTITETKIGDVKVDNILFDFDKAEIRPEMTQELNELAEFMQGHSAAYIVLAGYTCNSGSEEYNLGLSRKRTEIVADYLVSNYSISSDRIVRLWFGTMNPVADNSTKEGRHLNRRVEIAVGGL